MFSARGKLHGFSRRRKVGRDGAVAKSSLHIRDSPATGTLEGRDQVGNNNYALFIQS